MFTSSSDFLFVRFLYVLLCWIILWPGMYSSIYGFCGVGGVVLFSFDCLDCWYEEVGSVNVGMVGAPFKYPHSFIANLRDIGGLGCC